MLPLLQSSSLNALDVILAFEVKAYVTGYASKTGLTQQLEQISNFKLHLIRIQPGMMVEVPIVVQA